MIEVSIKRKLCLLLTATVIELSAPQSGRAVETAPPQADCVRQFPASVKVYPKEAGTPEEINVAADPYYYPGDRSPQPLIRIGKFSDGLASTDEKRFIATILQMKQQWAQLNHVELFVGAVRLYNFGYRDEATYWYYSAAYLQALYWRLVDVTKMGGQGSPSMDMYTVGEVFGESAAPKILGFAYCNNEEREAILRSVKSERAQVANMEALYPGVGFVSRTRWSDANTRVLSGLGLHRPTLPVGDYTYDFWGVTLDYSHLTSKHFPGGF